MRKFKSAIIPTILLLIVSVSVVHAESQPGKVIYNEGTRFEFEDFDLKFNWLIQPRFTFTDIDKDARRDLGIDSLGDSSSFTLRRARLLTSGNILEEDQFSYLLQVDFSEENGGSSLLDAFIQWNGELAKVRFGQFKVPFSREELIADQYFFFLERGIVNNEFSFARDQGAMLHGAIGDLGHWYTGLFNGNSDGETRNAPGVDTKLNWSSQVDFSSENFGGRVYEGDLREDGSFGWTAGTSFLYGQGSSAILSENAEDFDQWAINGDMAFRYSGSELQGEVFHRSVDFDDIGGDAGEEETTGFYLQATHVFGEKKWGVGARFGYIEPDEDISDIDDQQEYMLVLNYFIKGHTLKLQNGFTWEVTNLQEDDDFTDFSYILQLSGYF